MAFNGILLTVGDYDITGERYINYKSYSATANIQDMDSFRNANGVLTRNALEHVPIKIEFETRENLTNEDVAEFWGSIRSNFSEPKERKASVTAYIPEYDDYITQDCYIPDPQFKIKRITPDTNIIYYEPIRIAFIGY